MGHPIFGVKSFTMRWGRHGLTTTFGIRGIFREMMAQRMCQERAPSGGFVPSLRCPGREKSGIEVHHS